MKTLLYRKIGFRAFTLIELLISIAIISLLFGVVLANTNALRNSASDAQKKSDLASIQAALQNYYADQNYYPKSASGLVLGNGGSLTNTVGAAVPSPSPQKTYMRTIPVNAGDNYCYYAARFPGTTTACDNDNAVGGLCNYYYISANLDNPPAGATPAPAAINCGAAKNYVVAPN